MENKVTIEEVKEKFQERGYELLSTKYVNQKEKLLFICNKHREKGIQAITYADFKYKNRGCHFCTKERIANRDRIPIEEIQKVATKNGFKIIDVKYGSETGKATTYVYYICNKHSYVGVQHCDINSYMKKENGCHYCNFVLDTYTLKEKMKERYPHINILGEYNGQKEKVLCKCNLHNEEFYGKPYKLLQGVFGCKQCKKEKKQNLQRLTTDEYKNRLKKIHPELKVVGEYVDSTTPIEMFCTIHNCKFYESPNTYLYKKRLGCCPDFSNIKPEEQFQKELYEKHKGKIISLETYKGQSTEIKFKCLEHNFEWEATPAVVLLRKGCPKCTTTVNEIKIYNLLESLGYKFVRQKRFNGCRDKRTLPFDAYVPSLNLCIEYDGEGHYKERFYESKSQNPNFELSETKRRDKIKDDYCKNNNINLLRIPYWEHKNLENIIKDKIKEIENNNKLAC